MKKRIFNSTDVEVNMNILGIKVIIAPGEESIVDSKVGNALQECQPQLEYHDVDDKESDRIKKSISARLNAKLEEAKKVTEEVTAKAKEDVKEVKNELKELEKVNEKLAKEVADKDKEIKKLTNKKDDKAKK